jgi:hypothetical protein
MRYSTYRQDSKAIILQGVFGILTVEFEGGEGEQKSA